MPIILSVTLGLFCLFFSACGSENSGSMSAASTSESVISKLEMPSRLQRANDEIQVFNTVARIVGAEPLPADAISGISTAENPLAAAESLQQQVLTEISRRIDTHWVPENIYIVFNPLPWDRDALVTLDLTEDFGDKKLETVYVFDMQELIQPSQSHRRADGHRVIGFVAKQVPAWGWAAYFLFTNVTLLDKPLSTIETKTLNDGTRTITNSEIKISEPILNERFEIFHIPNARQWLKDPGLVIAWQDTDGQQAPSDIKSTIHYHARGPAYAMMRKTWNHKPSAYAVDAYVFNELPQVSLSFLTIPQTEGEFNIELAPALKPSLQEKNQPCRDLGAIDIADEQGGFLLMRNEDTKIEFDNERIKLSIPGDSAQQQVALLPHAATESALTLRKRTLEFLHPVHVLKTDSHEGPYSPHKIRYEETEKNIRFFPMLGITPEEVTAEIPSIDKNGDLVLTLKEQAGQEYTATVRLVRNIIAVDGKAVELQNRIELPLAAGERKTVRLRLAPESK